MLANFTHPMVEDRGVLSLHCDGWPASKTARKLEKQGLRMGSKGALSAPLHRMGGRVVECARLESVLGLKAHEGSNPSPSASFPKEN